MLYDRLATVARASNGRYLTDSLMANPAFYSAGRTRKSDPDVKSNIVHFGPDLCRCHINACNLSQTASAEYLGLIISPSRNGSMNSDRDRNRKSDFYAAPNVRAMYFTGIHNCGKGK